MKIKTPKFLVPFLSLCAALGPVTAGLAQPVTVAPTPSVPSGNVVSLYNSSATYTDISNVNFYEVWYGGQWTSFGDYNIPSTSSVVKGYQGLLFTGVGFESNPQNVSGCTNLHVDVFTPNGNSFAVRIVDTFGHQADITYTTASGVIVSNTWISLNLPLSQFKTAQPLLNFGHIQQLGWIINNPGETSPADYYIDNVYFSAATNLVFTPPPPIPTPTNAAPIPSRPASSVLSMYNSSATYADSPGINWDASWSGSAESDFTITNTSSVVKYMPGLSYVGVEFYDPSQIDTTGFTTLHFDVWTLDANQIGVQLVSLNPTTAAQVYVPLGVTNQWVGVDIPLSQFATANPATVLSHLQQLLWLDNGGPGIQNGTFYIDNVYFWTTNQVESSIAPGVQVGWTASSGSDTYQPQKSADNTSWSNFGAAISGNGTTSRFDTVPAPHYRVLDIAAAVANVALNPSFEIPAANNCGAANWSSGPNTTYESVWATNHYAAITPHDGTNLLYMEASTAASAPAAPNTYLLSDKFPVTGGVAYAISFYAANPVQVGGANPQYRVRFYDTNSALLTEQWNSFASAGASWTKFSQTNTAPTNAATMEFFFIQAVGAGASWDWVTLIDDIKVANSTAAPVNTTNVLAATLQPALGISWHSGTGLTYSVQSSPTISPSAWSPLGANVTAAGTNTTVSDLPAASKKFYRVLEVY